MMLLLSVEIILEKIWEKFRGHAGLASHKSATGLGLGASFRAPSHQIPAMPLQLHNSLHMCYKAAAKMCSVQCVLLVQCMIT